MSDNEILGKTRRENVRKSTKILNALRHRFLFLSPLRRRLWSFPLRMAGLRPSPFLPAFQDFRSPKIWDEQAQLSIRKRTMMATQPKRNCPYRILCLVYEERRRQREPKVEGKGDKLSSLLYLFSLGNKTPPLLDRMYF